MKLQIRYDSIWEKIYFQLTFIFIACNQYDKRNISPKKMTIDDSLKIELIGKWGGLGENTPVWKIGPDSIYYYDQSTSYPYKILNGDFIIDFFSSKGTLKHMVVIKDTMYYLDEQGIMIRGYRFPDSTLNK